MSTFVLAEGDVLCGLVLELSEGFQGLVVLEIPDENASVGGSSEPLISWVELKTVDLSFGLELDCGFFQIVDVPNIDKAVFASGGNIFPSGCNRKSIDSSLMSSEGVFDLEILVPNLQESVPADGGEVFTFVRW